MTWWNFQVRKNQCFTVLVNVGTIEDVNERPTMKNKFFINGHSWSTTFVKYYVREVLRSWITKFVKYYVREVLRSWSTTLVFVNRDLYLIFVHFFKRIVWSHLAKRGLRGHGPMVAGFTITYAISAYHRYRCEFASSSGLGVLDTTLCDKVCQWLEAGRWFSPGTSV
jgi:hypothetical protein